MRKTYHAKSELCINVRMGDGHKHIAFIPHTMGGSSLTTDDPQLQSAIEQHRLFGSFITVEVMREETAMASQSPKGSGNARANANDNHAPLEMTFNSYSDARDYVANQWGISRSKLRHREDIMRHAAEHHVKIILHSG
ncbi:MAG: hypothetical protein J6Y97_06730 [Prevotella sp.]|nr:hypothetical protein [Prevotella sp.]MBP5507341.1 hypothetical protein [Prevotella sp.]